MPARGVVVRCKGLQARTRLGRVPTGDMDETVAMLRVPLSDDCHLLLLEVADADELYRLIDANRDHLTPWMPWAADQQQEGTLDFIRTTLEQVADNNGFRAAFVCDG